uniref:ATP-grasp domain-containing protein n=1 Tax=Panagrellus redivivus TaxID=6233 RepID=A0A7E4W376_PANRE
MGKIFDDPDTSMSLTSTSSGDDNLGSAQQITRDFLRLATCCAIEKFPFIKKWSSVQESEEIEYLLLASETEAPFLRASIFDHMPPTILFHGKNQAVKSPCYTLKKGLIWAQNPLLPNPMRTALRQNHFSIEAMEENEQWLGYWGRHWKTDEYHTMSENQKVNHYPGSFHLGRKDRIWTHMVEFMRRFGEEFDLMPRTFLMPDDLETLHEYLNEKEEHAVILKPPASARGAGITIVSDAANLPELDLTLKKNKHWVAQEYIENPLLINDKKFDLRIYAYVPCLDPLTIYIYDEGLVRFAALPYEHDNLDNQYIHLTNYSINRYAQRDGKIVAPVDKWSLSQFWDYMESLNYSSEDIKSSIKDMVIKTIIACESYIRDHMQVNNISNGKCHELFGFDILLDEDLRPHLLEVNISPSLQAHTDVDKKVKIPLAKDVLTMCRYPFPVPNHLLDDSPANATKHCDGNITQECKEKITDVLLEFKENRAIITNILHVDTLTGSDIRCLTNFENEYDCRGDFELIYPSKDSHLLEHYFQFIRNPTYFDILMKEYTEQRFSSNAKARELIDLLHHMCYLGNHIVTDDQRLDTPVRLACVNLDYIYDDDVSQSSVSS